MHLLRGASPVASVSNDVLVPTGAIIARESHPEGKLVALLLFRGSHLCCGAADDESHVVPVPGNPANTVPGPGFEVSVKFLQSFTVR